MNIINKKKKNTFHHHNNGNNSSNDMKIDAVEKAYTSFFHAIRNGQIEIVKTMIGNGFDVNKSITDQEQRKRKRRINALQYACIYCDNVHIFDILVNATKHKNNINQQMKYSGETLLILATKWDNKFKIIQYLINHSCFVSSTDIVPVPSVSYLIHIVSIYACNMLNSNSAIFLYDI
jgi:hypothetical protein